jgi:putative transposase
MILVLLRALALACRGHHELVLENLALRQQLHALKRTVSRPQLRRRDRLFWIVLTRTWRNWRAALVLVQPDTVVRWHREWLRRRWTRRSWRIRAGRPRTDVAIRTLVSKMAAANPRWGAPRIHGELGRVGVEVSGRTVSRLLRRPRRPPSQTWHTFLTNHVATLASDRFLHRTDLHRPSPFVLVVLMHHRRRIVHVNVTEHPTVIWTAQQMIEAFPDDTAPRWLLRDRDAIYGDAFRRRVAGIGIGEVISSPSSPWQNPYAERLIGSIRRECLDHVIVLGERHLRRTLSGAAVRHPQPATIGHAR